MLKWLRARRSYRALVESDANNLIAGYGPDDAYDLARERSTAAFDTVIDSDRPEGHWDNVRRAIKRKTGRPDYVDTATKMANRDV